MLDVRIRHCRLRVVRHGGWSWGVDRGRLIDMASAKLPALIADLLEQLPLVTQGDVSIDKLTLRLSCHADTLAADPLASNPIINEHWSGSLKQQLHQQIAVGSPRLILEQSPLQPELDESTPQMSAAPSNVAQLLALWRNQGSLAEHLYCFTLQALALWEAVWLRSRRGQPLPGEDAAERQDQQAEALLRILPDYGRTPSGVRRARLHLLAELDFHTAGTLGADEVRVQLDRCMPIVDETNDAGAAHAQEDATGRVSTGELATPNAEQSDPHARHGHQAHPPFSPLHSVSDIDTHVASALPYLVLGTLHQLGYLQAALTTLESGTAMSLVHCLSAALASKLLPLDQSMDQREKRHLIATYSLAEQPPGPQAYACFEDTIGPALSAANAGIYAGLLAGHQEGTPVLICERNPGWMLFDTLGMFPLTLAESNEDLKMKLQPYRDAVVMVPGASVSRGLMETILDAGCPFVTDAVPVRNEPWIAVDRARRFHAHRDRPMSSAATRRFQVCATAATELLDEHLPPRRVLPERRQTGLDGSAELAAGAGLADLAYLLWGDREATHPLLAYRRLHDLEARVRVDKERVRVSLALGQRYFDLHDKGVLQDVAGVPWFAGRTLMFSGL